MGRIESEMISPRYLKIKIYPEGADRITLHVWRDKTWQITSGKSRSNVLSRHTRMDTATRRAFKIAKELAKTGKR